MTANQDQGIAFCGIGILGCLVGVVLPVWEAHAGATEVSYYMSMSLVTPLLIVLGLVHAVGGTWAEEHLGSPYHPTRLGGMLVLMLLGIGFVVHMLVAEHLRALGYLI